MTSSGGSKAYWGLGLLVIIGAGIALYFYFARKPKPPLPLPGPDNPKYEEYASAFLLGTAYLDVGLNEQAQHNLTKAIELIPEEPAAWANRAILSMREGNRLKQAAADLAKARDLAPDNADLEEIAGFLTELENKLPESEAHFRKASAASPGNVRRLYKIADVIAKEAAPDADKQRLKILEQILELQPDNLFVLAEHAFLAAKLKDLALVKATLARMDKLAGDWHDNSRKHLDLIKKDAAADPPDPALQYHIRQLGSLLEQQEAGFAKWKDAVAPVGAQVATLVQKFIKLAPLRTTPDEPDLTLSFPKIETQFLPEVNARKWLGVVPLWRDLTKPPDAFVFDALQVRSASVAGTQLEFPGAKAETAPGIDSVLGVDWDNSRRPSIVLAGPGGLRLYHQKGDGSFEDVSAQTKLPADVLGGSYHGAWAIDVDFDGDVDILLARRDGAPLLLRNNFDGTFTPAPIFPGVEKARVFVWLDLDNDGANDAALLDESGRLHVFMNQRSATFVRRAPPEAGQGYCALAVADVNDDGTLDLIALRLDGTLVRLSDVDKGNRWEVVELGKLNRELPLRPGAVRLIAADIDNNGAIDLVFRTAAGGVAWLGAGKDRFEPLPAPVPPGTAGLVDLNENGLLDVLGLDEQGHPVLHEVAGTKGYQWFDVKPRSLIGMGDNRVNSFSLGGEIELRSGALVAKQPIDRPTVHFGTGSRKRVELLKVQWSNGSFQYEFENVSGKVVVVTQRLKGSCPFLFAWNGERIEFVTDFCWSTPLGMYINAQDKGGFSQTTDWAKIRGDQLRPRDGVYDVRVNANLWETHYLDELGLVVVDHPPGTEVHIDERFFLEPTKPQVYLTGPSRPIAGAWDHKGEDVTQIVQSRDGVYLDRCGRGIYQGVTNDHWVEVDLGDDIPDGPIYLLAYGWIHPTDSSINTALEQNKSIVPKPLTLEIPDGKGGWKVGRGGLGFPAGKNKTCVIRLDGIDGAKAVKRFRLRTNLEIYWDSLHFAAGLDAAQCRQQRLPAKTAELQFRGILNITQASPSAPQLPHYDEVICRSQFWRDLIGFHTRFGDVRELIERADDRFVIMNAGDELRLTYQAPDAPPAGWQRDFVWICDGWVKDGDLNTRWGKTVLPLPYHGMKEYGPMPARLEDDPVFKRFPNDWVKYHTRYVTPARFERGLRSQ